MRAAKVTFGERPLCPFLRPFFLTEAEEERIRRVAETIAAIGERIVEAALASPALLAELGLSEEEIHLARIEPGNKTASTASRLDSFLLPDSFQFAEYNAESPAGPGYAEVLGGIFRGLDVMKRFEQRYRVRMHSSIELVLAALLASYREWGGTPAPPSIAIVDWREVPTWSEFEILRENFERLGTPTILCDPRDLEFDGRALTGTGRKIDLVYRRVLINDIVARPAECEALVEAYAARAVCVANTFRCKIPHKKAFFAILTDELYAALFSAAERVMIARHVPWTRRVVDARTTRHGKAIALLEHIRAHREELVLKPNDEYGGSGVTLGWETSPAQWDEAIERALREHASAWIVQERIAIRREVFPRFDGGEIRMGEMLVDAAPFLFRGKLSGYLTRLSATGLANVTSGGGQTPAFIVAPRA